MGLPLRVALPILAVIGALFLGIMGYLLKIGLGTPGTALGAAGSSAPPAVARRGDAEIVATPGAVVTDPPGTFAVPNTGTGAAGATQPLPDAPPGASGGRPVGGGGPPAPVKALLDDLNRRIAANPRDLAAIVALGNLEFDAGKYDKALVYYRRALVLDPGNPDVRTDEATALHESGHDLESLAELDAVLKARPAFRQALFNRGIVLRAIGRREDAVAAFRKFIAAAPGDARVAEAKRQIAELQG